MKLYLVRHGESKVNIPDSQPKRREELDAGLTELGHKQAAILADWMIQEVPHINALYSSTLKRAMETAQFLAQVYNCQIFPDDRLREIGNNRIDHSPLPNDALPQNYTHLSLYQFPFSPIAPDEDNAESFMHFRTRVGLFLEALLNQHEGQTVIVVGHGGTVNAICDLVFNIGSYRRCDVRCAYTSVSHFQYMGLSERETWRITYLGRTDHLAIGLKA
jgi:probable phosphoglycerate mutase